MTELIVNGQPIFFKEEGPDQAPVAVLIHGWSSSSFTWAPVLPLVSRRYRCISIDLPGFGESSQPIQTPTIAWYADLVGEIIERFSPERPALVMGHSMGGQIAATLALRHPQLVEQLVLLNPALSGRLSTRVNMLFAPHVMAERLPVLEWLLHLAAQTPLDYTDALLKPSNFAERAQITEADYQRIRADARRVGQGRTRAACFVAMRNGDLRGRLAQVEQPSLVIWGAEDNVVPLRDAGAVAAEWPKADLRLIPNAGHWPQFEQPEPTLRHIASFLGLPPRRGYQSPVSDDLEYLRGMALFLNNTEIGGRMTEAQRLQLASLLHSHGYAPGEHIATMDSQGQEMYVVEAGQLDVWVTPTLPDGRKGDPVLLASLNAGQVAGELSLLDGAPRSADLRAGPHGATLLTLTAEGLATLANEDPRMGMQLMQNLAISLGRRLRTQNRRATRAEAQAAQATQALEVENRITQRLQA